MHVPQINNTNNMEDVNLDIAQIEQDLSMSRGERPEIKFNMDVIGEAIVEDEFGIKHKFKTLYQHNKTLVIFIRHFLCFMSKEYCDDLALIPEKYFKEANVNLILIGCGPHKFIKPFRKTTGYRGPFFVDTERVIYQSVGFYGKEKKFNEEEATKTLPSCHIKSNFMSGIVQATWRGMEFKEFQGDMSQLGGALIMGPGDVIHYHHFDTAAFDHAPLNDLLGLVGVQHVNFPRDARVLDI